MDPNSHKPSGSTNAKNKKKTCIHFMRNRCTYGEKCKFAHSSDKSPPAKNVCDFFYYVGECVRGNTCPYKHEGSETSEENRTESSAITIHPTDEDHSNVRTNHPSSFKTKLCSEWMNHHHCPFGVNCIYAHGEAELVQAPSSTGSRSRDSMYAPRTQDTSASASNPGNQTFVQFPSSTGSSSRNSLDAPRNQDTSASASNPGNQTFVQFPSSTGSRPRNSLDAPRIQDTSASASNPGDQTFEQRMPHLMSLRKNAEIYGDWIFDEEELSVSKKQP